MGSVELHILGQKYTIKGDVPEEHIRRLVAYVNEKIQEVYENSPQIAPLKASILAAINIADELHKLRDEQETIAKHIEEKTEVLSRLFD